METHGRLFLPFSSDSSVGNEYEKQNQLLITFPPFSRFSSGLCSGRPTPVAVTGLRYASDRDVRRKARHGKLAVRHPRPNRTDQFHQCGQGHWCTGELTFVLSLNFGTEHDLPNVLQGFRIVWTEVQETPVGSSSTLSLLCESTYHWQCQISGFCISERLRCDGVKNCGASDNSDEMHCES